MEIPETILKCIEDAAVKHPHSVEQAIACAAEKVKKHKDYQSAVDALVHDCIVERIHSCRHNINTEIRNQARHYENKSQRKVNPMDSETVKDSYAELFLFRVAGQTLGDLCGEDLEPLAQREERNADGYLFRARLLRLCAAVTPKNKTIKQSVSGKKLKEFFDKAEQAA